MISDNDKLITFKFKASIQLKLSVGNSLCNKLQDYKKGVIPKDYYNSRLRKMLTYILSYILF